MPDEEKIIKLFDDFGDSIYEHISFEDFKFTRLSKLKNNDEDEPDIKEPSSKGIIIKTHFVYNEEMDRKFPNKSFFSYSKDSELSELVHFPKKIVSTDLKDAIVNYIKMNNCLNNNFTLIEKSITKKTNAVKFEVKFTDFVIFIITINPNDFDGIDDVSSFISSLKIEETKPQSKKVDLNSDPWKIELAKSARSTCKTCNQKIEKNAIRLGKPGYYQDHLTYQWHHLKCIKNFNQGTILEGLDSLDEKQKTDVNAWLFKDSTESGDPIEIIQDIIVKYENSEGLTSESDIYKYGSQFNLSNEKIKATLETMEVEGLLYRPDQGKIKLL